MTKAHSRQSRLWTAAGAPAGISRCCSSKRRAVWVSAQGWSQATFSIPARCSSDRQTPDQRTHAWGEVFVSGAGWISFDPTNRSVGGANLIPVAVARDIQQAAPVSGTYAGNSDALLGMAVEVLLTSTAAPTQRQASEQSSSVDLAFSGADRFSP